MRFFQVKPQFTLNIWPFCMLNAFNMMFLCLKHMTVSVRAVFKHKMDIHTLFLVVDGKEKQQQGQ